MMNLNLKNMHLQILFLNPDMTEIASENPCLNSGTPQQTSSGVICLCPTGYTGLMCETGE